MNIDIPKFGRRLIFLTLLGPMVLPSATNAQVSITGDFQSLSDDGMAIRLYGSGFNFLDSISLKWGFDFYDVTSFSANTDSVDFDLPTSNYPYPHSPSVIAPWAFLSESQLILSSSNGIVFGNHAFGYPNDPYVVTSTNYPTLGGATFIVASGGDMTNPGGSCTFFVLNGGSLTGFGGAGGCTAWVETGGTFVPSGGGGGGNVVTFVDSIQTNTLTLVTPTPPPDSFWAPSAGGGGSGVWSSTNSDWASSAGEQGNLPPATNAAFVFANAAGTVTVDGVVVAPAGLRFKTNGYMLTNGVITLAGDSQSANRITTDTGVTAAIASALAGTQGLTKSGSGTLILDAASTYTGRTAISEGVLVVNGSVSNSAVTVNGGGTLAGSGSVGGIVLNVGSTISPGNSPGTLTVAGNAVWNPGANYNWQIYDASGTAGTTTGWDLLNVTGSLDLSALGVGSEFKINLWSLSAVAPDSNGSAVNFDPTQNYTWTILSAAGGISGFNPSGFIINTGAFNGTSGFQNGLAVGSFSLISTNNNLNLLFTAAGGPGPGPSGIPEPGTWAAAALLVGSAAFVRWRRRRLT